MSTVHEDFDLIDQCAIGIEPLEIRERDERGMASIRIRSIHGRRRNGLEAKVGWRGRAPDDRKDRNPNRYRSRDHGSVALLVREEERITEGRTGEFGF